MVHTNETMLPGPDRDGRWPQLRIRETDETRAVVLVLHGGKVASNEAPRWTSSSVSRMEPFARALWRDGRERGVAVWSLLFARRGWNDTGAPLQDARWALAEVERRYGSVPVVILGHSMGGRTAVRVAGHPSVVGVVALAPWLPSGEPRDQLAGRELAVIHGTADLWVPITMSRRFVATLGDVPVRVDYTALRGSGHAMLLRSGVWHSLATEAVARMLAPHLGQARADL